MACKNNPSIENASIELVGWSTRNLNDLTVIRRFVKPHSVTLHAFCRYRNGQEHGKNDRNAQRDDKFFLHFDNLLQ